MQGLTEMLSALSICTTTGPFVPALPPSTHTMLIMSWRKSVFISAFQRLISITYFRLSPKRQQLKQANMIICLQSCSAHPHRFWQQHVCIQTFKTKRCSLIIYFFFFWWLPEGSKLYRLFRLLQVKYCMFSSVQLVPAFVLSLRWTQLSTVAFCIFLFFVFVVAMLKWVLSCEGRG